MIDIPLPHEPPEGYSYEVKRFKSDIASIWLLNHNISSFTGRNSHRTIWGFYNTRKEQYYSPVTSTKQGDPVEIHKQHHILLWFLILILWRVCYMDKPYEPEVDDYVVWERETWVGKIKDEGWVYFKGDPVEPKKGFSTPVRYITIETGVRDKPKEQLEGSMVRHRKIHTLLLCYEQQWKDLKFIRKRESKVIQHYSQYDDRAGEVL